jgi:outer membrane protein OmpA-like peptidoglycan-associated protein/tetratricopeptide (TPR) repeat protein
MKAIKYSLFIPFLLTGLLSGNTLLFGQHNNIIANLKSVERRANELYANGAYGQAVELYKQVLEKEAGNFQAILNIADSYVHLNEQDHAVLWYEKAMAGPSPIESRHKLAYAQALASAADYTRAKVWFENYLKDMPTDRRAKLQLEAIDHIQQFAADSALYQVKKLKINTAQPDFGPAFYQEGLVFVSGRSITKPVKWVNTADQGAFYDLYYSKIDEDGELSETGKLQQDLNSRYHEGPVAFFENGSRIMFTQNAVQHSARKGVNKRLALFEAEKSKDGNWVNVKPFPFNGDSYSVAHPSISKNADVLYFASDMPGGYGQSDIYVSRRLNGSWSKPENLGPSVNTEGNEMFPYIHNNTLYFASNGLGGLGGLDIFSLDVSNATPGSKNLGMPVNSSRDDFGLILNEKNTGYFSTNRIRENKDDLYWVKYTGNAAVAQAKPVSATKPISTRLKGVIYEKGTNKVLAGALVYIINEQTGEDLSLIADAKGSFSFEARLEDSYAIMAEKEEKNVFVINIITPDFSGKDKLIKLEASAVSFPTKIVIEASLFDSLTHEPVEFAGAFLFEGSEEKQRDYSTPQGKAYLNTTRGAEYWLHILSISHEERNYAIPKGLKAINDTLKISIPLQGIKPMNNMVKGNIFDEETGNPVVNAEVYILNERTGDQQSMFSDQKGDFTFKAIAGDTYLFMGEKDKLYVFLPGVPVKDPQKFPDHIYRLGASSPKFVRDYIVEALVFDSLTQQPLRFAEIAFSGNGRESSFYTPSSGKIYHQISGKESFKINAKLKGYKHYAVAVAESSIPANDTLRITLALQKSAPDYIVSLGYIYDKITKEPVDQASIYLLNATTGEEQIVKSNTKGMFEWNAVPSDTYLIVGEKGNKSIFVTNYTFDSPETAANTNVELAIEAPVFAEKQDEKVGLEALIIDKDSREPIKFAFIKVLKDGVSLEDAFSDERGRVNLQLDKGTGYELRSEKPRYADQSVQISTTKQNEKILLTLELSKLKPEVVTVSGNAFDLQAGTPMHNAEIYVLDKNTGEQNKVITDAEGNFEFPAIKAHTYTVLGEKGNMIARPVEFEAASVSEKIALLVQPEKVKQIVIAATVLDSHSGNPIKAATLKIIEKNREKNGRHTSLKGKSWLTAAIGEEIELNVSAHHFISRSIQISTKQPSVNDTIQVNVLLEPQEPVLVVQNAAFINKSSGEPIANANVFLLNKHTGEEQDLQTDAKGMFSFSSSPGEVFSIFAEKDELKDLLINVKIQEKGDTIKLAAIPPAKREIYARVIAKDKVTQEPVKFLEIDVETDKKETQKFYTSLKGEVVFKVDPDHKYLLKTVHINYREELKELALNAYQSDTVIVEFYLEKQEPVFTTLQIQVIDEKTRRPLPNAEVSVQNEATGEEGLLMTDEGGRLPLKVKIKESYTISSSSAAYSSAKLTGVKAVADAKSADKQIILSVVSNNTKSKSSLTASSLDLIEVNSGHKQLFVSADGELYEYIVAGDSVLLRNKTNTHLLSHQQKIADEGTSHQGFFNFNDTASITSKSIIRNIYYDFDKTSLSAEAKEELSKIAVVMKAYPMFTIKINGFSDSRGAGAYNLKLSGLRAREAASYLISLGIDESRITSEGYGETYLLKPCPKVRDCDQNEHQLNRRGEFVLNINNQ